MGNLASGLHYGMTGQCLQGKAEGQGWLIVFSVMRYMNNEEIMVDATKNIAIIFIVRTFFRICFDGCIY